MNGFDFLPRRNASLFTYWEQPELRVPSLAVAVALMFVVATLLVEHNRLTAERGQRERVQAEVAVLDGRVAQFRRLDVEARNDHALAAVLLRLRHSAVRRANEIAQIGNCLSADAWLSVLQHDDAGWHVGGAAAHLRDISVTIMALRPLSGPQQRLDNVTTTTGGDGVTRLRYQLSLGKQLP